MSNSTRRKAKSSVAHAISEAESKGQEAVGAVREVGDNIAGAIDSSLETRPYTTLSLALGMGFLFGAIWRH
jgi:ElaB/YqjD/DUF883 family membrane-anchored ribosome-binding protein